MLLTKINRRNYKFITWLLQKNWEVQSLSESAIGNKIRRRIWKIAGEFPGTFQKQIFHVWIASNSVDYRQFFPQKLTSWGFTKWSTARVRRCRRNARQSAGPAKWPGKKYTELLLHFWFRNVSDTDICTDICIWYLGSPGWLLGWIPRILYPQDCTPGPDFIY